VDDPSELLHPVYLPVTRQRFVDEHFAPIVGDKQDRERFLRYYETSLANLKAFERARHTPSQLRKATVVGRQIEKDERFWVAGALLAAFRPDEGARLQTLARLLDRTFGEGAPSAAGFSTWAEALAGELRLYFEVNVPSPPAYRQWLKEHLNERVLVRYQREAAGRVGHRLEGATKLDAVLLYETTGVAVVFEAKVLSDVSTMVANDVLRNQLARTIDVVLDRHEKLAPPLVARRPERTYVALLTPGIFKQRPDSRLYGRLFEEYCETPEVALTRDLPHRVGVDWGPVAERLGWLTYEECSELVPGSCAWLAPPG
jgi:hypothetical protein